MQPYRIYAEDSTIWSSSYGRVSNSAALNVPHAIFSASVVGFMRATIIVTQITSVRPFAGSAKTSLGHAVHGMLYFPYLSLLLKEVQCRASWHAYVSETCA